MPTVGAYQAKTKFSELVARVQKGERITITRYGEPVAVLVPVESAPASPIGEVIQGIKTLREKSSLEDLDLREIIEEGRA
jgi:prevent-host-death family protein